MSPVPALRNYTDNFAENIDRIESRLWKAADDLRANSNKNSSEYFEPVMGLLFLRHAFNRYLVAKVKATASLPTFGGKTLELTPDDFTSQGALFLRPESQYDNLLSVPGGQSRSKAIIDAMEAIEKDYENLRGVLPKNYTSFDDALLERMLRTFNDDALKTTDGDIFGRIYEYFLMQFSMQRAQDGGEFLTPVALVRLLVAGIEPHGGLIVDPACGSGGMFVEVGHHLMDAGKIPNEAARFRGQEKSESSVKLAIMNLAVHGLSGTLKEGNTFYEPLEDVIGKADFVLANPPFNVDSVDARRIESDQRIVFGMPAVNNDNIVSNANYLWISYFYSYLNERGRAGFVMSSQASSASGAERGLRQRLVESGHVDMMVSIGSNFFYTRTVPCELWYLNKAKPEARRQHVLMVDARPIFRQVNRRIRDFSPDLLHNLSAIFWLYRGESERYLGLIVDYLQRSVEAVTQIAPVLATFDSWLTRFVDQFAAFERALSTTDEHAEEDIETYRQLLRAFSAEHADYVAERQARLPEFAAAAAFLRAEGEVPPDNKRQQTAAHELEQLLDPMKRLTNHLAALVKGARGVADFALDTLAARDNEKWENRAGSQWRKELESASKTATEQLKVPGYLYRQMHWLQSRFPDAVLVDVPGLVKLAPVLEIEANDWSLTPGRYVGVAPQEVDDDFDFEEQIALLHDEIQILNGEAALLATRIQDNFESIFE